MIVVYRADKSKSAYDLVAWFANNNVLALRARSADDLAKFLQNEPRLVFGWGSKLPLPYERSLNALAPMGTKYQQLVTLDQAGVVCPRVSLESHRGWLTRSNQHHDGSDLVQGGRGDYYSERVNTTHEFRVNVFRGKAFRTGVKRPMTATERSAANAPEAHEFIRTKPFGWTWTYQQTALDATRVDRGPYRAAAEAAVKALGYDFGAVDIGRRTDGTPVVFEVNTAPALEGSDLSRWGQLFIDHASK